MGPTRVCLYSLNEHVCTWKSLWKSLSLSIYIYIYQVHTLALLIVGPTWWSIQLDPASLFNGPYVCTLDSWIDCAPILDSEILCAVVESVRMIRWGWFVVDRRAPTRSLNPVQQLPPLVFHALLIHLIIYIYTHSHMRNSLVRTVLTILQWKFPMGITYDPSEPSTFSPSPPFLLSSLVPFSLNYTGSDGFTPIRMVWAVG